MARFPLQSLLDHALHRQEAAERLLRLLRKRETEAQAQLDALRAYRTEYQRQFGVKGEAGLPIHLLRDYHGFLGKMEEAVKHQELAVELARTNLKRGHAQWEEVRRKVKAYQTMADRHAAKEKQKEERRDQRVTDEFAGRSFQRNGEDPLT